MKNVYRLTNPEGHTALISANTLDELKSVYPLFTLYLNYSYVVDEAVEVKRLYHDDDVCTLIFEI